MHQYLYSIFYILYSIFYIYRLISSGVRRLLCSPPLAVCPEMKRAN